MKVGVVCTVPALFMGEPLYMLYHIVNYDAGIRLRVRVPGKGNGDPYMWVHQKHQLWGGDEIPSLYDMSEEEYFQYSLVHHLDKDLDIFKKTQELFMKVRNEGFTIGVERRWEIE